MDSFARLIRAADIHGLHFTHHVHITYARICPPPTPALSHPKRAGWGRGTSAPSTALSSTAGSPPSRPVVSTARLLRLALPPSLTPSLPP
eukprot:3466262-Rhodomonas_salina.1